MSFASSPTVRLKVQQVEHTCLFELSWGDGMQLSSQVPAPEPVYRHYANWQRAYLNFYKTASLALSTPIQPSSSASGSASTTSEMQSQMRGRLVGAGKPQVTPQNRHSQLIQAEALLRYEFQMWLRSAQLYDIRATLAAITRSLSPQAGETNPSLTLYLTCSPLVLARLPWETWEIGTEFATAHSLRIVRSPANIRKPSNAKGIKRRKPRILAILGDDTGLSFRADREAVRSLSRLAEVQFAGWQPGQTAAEVKTDICNALTDTAGWDVLFFAGHSNETQMTGGELAIAPNTSISLKDLTPFLITAQTNGLQFALFNSCSGLNIAESLIDLGFSQVAVMREPVHNRVAQEFLVKFFQALAAHADVQSALSLASRFLEVEKSFDFPSAYLVPSLFCHPGAKLFHIPAAGWQQAMLRAMPRRYEAIALAGCLALAWSTPLQGWLLDQRIGLQARYRAMTHQVPTDRPPVALVQINRHSIERRGINGNEINPMRRDYLADILDAMLQNNARIIGIDYLLDTLQRETDPILANSVEAAIKQDAWLVFASIRKGRGDIGVSAQTQITHSAWSLEGIINVYPDILSLPNPDESCRQQCPFGYVLALIHRLQARSPNQAPSPAARLAEFPPQVAFSDTSLLNPSSPPKTLHDQLIDRVERVSETDEAMNDLHRFRYSPISVWAANRLRRFWLLPLIDYSIPPSQIYVRIPAWTLLDPDAPETPDALRDLDLSEQVVILGSNYAQAGIDGEDVETDRFPRPRGYAYWFRQGDTPDLPGLPAFESEIPSDITGAEFHAYNVHHLMRQHRVIAVPAFWMVGLAALISKPIASRLRLWISASHMSSGAAQSSAQMSEAHAHLHLQLNSQTYSQASSLSNVPPDRQPATPLNTQSAQSPTSIAFRRLRLPQTLQQSSPRQRQLWAIAATTTGLAGYGMASLQLYISAQIVLPWLLPSVVVWAYLLPAIRRKKS